MVFNYSTATTYSGGHCFIVGLFSAPSGLKNLWIYIPLFWGICNSFLWFSLEMKLLMFLLDKVTKCGGKLTIFRPGNETKCTLHLFYFLGVHIPSYFLLVKVWLCCRVRVPELLELADAVSLMSCAVRIHGMYRSLYKVIFCTSEHLNCILLKINLIH